MAGETEECKACDGRGYRENRNYYEFGPPLIECPECDGTGKVQPSTKFQQELQSLVLVSAILNEEE